MTDQPLTKRERVLRAVADEAQAQGLDLERTRQAATDAVERFNIDLERTAKQLVDEAHGSESWARASNLAFIVEALEWRQAHPDAP